MALTALIVSRKASAKPAVWLMHVWLVLMLVLIGATTSATAASSTPSAFVAWFTSIASALIKVSRILLEMLI